MAVPLVGGIPVTVAIARTTTNFKAGARTHVAGIVHAMTLLAVLIVAPPLGVLTAQNVDERVKFLLGQDDCPPEAGESNRG